MSKVIETQEPKVEASAANTSAENTAKAEAPKPAAAAPVKDDGLPKTQAEFEEALRNAKLEGAKESAKQASKQIAKLEEKVATKIGVNGFPKIVKEGVTYELQYCSNMLIKNDEGLTISISYEAMINNEVAQRELDMSAKEVVALIYEKHPNAFTKVK